MRISTSGRSRVLAFLTVTSLAGCTAGVEVATQEADQSPPEVDEQAQSLLVLGDQVFTAYYGGNRFDPAAVFGVEQPEISFNAVRAPLAELEGEERDIDLSEPSGWVFLMNLQYGADVDVLWHTLVFEAGMPGLGGTLRVRGAREPLSFALQYNVHFSGDMDLPGFSDNPVGLQLTSKNLGMAPAEEIREEIR